MHYYPSNRWSLKDRDAQLQELRTALSLARISRNKHMITDLEKKIQKCGQSTSPVSFSRKSKKARRR